MCNGSYMKTCACGKQYKFNPEDGNYACNECNDKAAEERYKNAPCGRCRYGNEPVCLHEQQDFSCFERAANCLVEKCNSCKYQPEDKDEVCSGIEVYLECYEPKDNFNSQG